MRGVPAADEMPEGAIERSGLAGLRRGLTDGVQLGLAEWASEPVPDSVVGRGGALAGSLLLTSPTIAVGTLTGCIPIRAPDL